MKGFPLMEAMWVSVGYTSVMCHSLNLYCDKMYFFSFFDCYTAQLAQGYLFQQVSLSYRRQFPKTRIQMYIWYTFEIGVLLICSEKENCMYNVYNGIYSGPSILRPPVGP